MSNDPILFVDDDLISRLLNCAVLRDGGFETLEARSYAEAARLIQQHPRLAALVTKVDLGNAVDGFELARLARDANAQITIVYLAGPDVQQFFGQGVIHSRFIAKPCDPRQIVRALDEATPLAPVRLT